MPSTTSFDAPAAEIASPTPFASHSGALVCLPALSAEALSGILSATAAAFPSESVTVSTPVLPSDASGWPSLKFISTPPEAAPSAGGEWVLSAADFAGASSILNSASSAAEIKVLLLFGSPTADAPAPDAALIRLLADGVRNSNVDFVLPRYTPGPSEGLVNSALIYPLTRSLFGADVRFPLPTEAALSPRMAARLAVPAQRQVNLSQGAALLWPVAEASIAGLAVREVVTTQDIPQRSTQDFNALFGSVAGSLFGDIEAKATFWQRARNLTLRPTSIPLSPLPFDPEDANDEALLVSAQISEMIESFHLAHSNLQEIWSLVLPPQSRLALKKLSTVSVTDFVIEPELWARIVYDFTLSFHLRTLNRGHLLGAMVPLYLAWVASHLNTVGVQMDRAEARIEATAAAFETEKSYLVSRWRWPDRFNP